MKIAFEYYYEKALEIENNIRTYILKLKDVKMNKYGDAEYLIKLLREMATIYSKFAFIHAIKSEYDE